MSASVLPLRPSEDGKPQAPHGDDLLEARARELCEKFADASAHDILRAVISEEFPGKITLVSSFGAEAAALLHMVSEIDPATPVIFLETGKHFAQTISYRKKIAARLGLTGVRDIKPDAKAVSEEDPHGDLWRHDADACCNLRKVEPLAGALEPFDAWITGRKQFHGGTRLRLPIFETSGTHIKVNPLARWSKDQVADYLKEHDLPAHPLVSQGYPSIGCWPCTHPVAEGEDARAGRWRGAAKTECGIHDAARRPVQSAP